MLYPISFQFALEYVWEYWIKQVTYFVVWGLHCSGIADGGLVCYGAMEQFGCVPVFQTNILLHVHSWRWKHYVPPNIAWCDAEMREKTIMALLKCIKHIIMCS